jgi:hypothetical protein
VVDEGREGRGTPAVGVVFVRKSAFRLVLERTARRALRSEVVGWVAVAWEEEGEEAEAAFGVAVVVGLKVDEDEGRVIDEVLDLLFLASVMGANARFPRCAAAAAEADSSVLPRR